MQRVNQPSSFYCQGPNSVFEVYLVGNNSNHFIISPTSIQGKADIRVRVAVPLDFETIPRYEFSVREQEEKGDGVLNVEGRRKE